MSADRSEITLWLTGDVMTGRGIDQVLPHPGDPRLHESYMRSATGYVALAERETGPIPAPVDAAYVWGDALAVLECQAPALRLINLETAITTSEDAQPKGIHYRMHPANRGVLDAAWVDGVVLANNHVLDWGREGLLETLAVLEAAGIRQVGAGRDRAEATAPQRFTVPGGSVRLLAYGLPSSGVPLGWAASERQAGINVLPELSSEALRVIGDDIARGRCRGEVVVVSLHWGSNWGYEIPEAHRAFAHRLIDEAGVDLVWGHSAHHVLGIEIHHGKLILYGCGDLINDYEGITGHELFRDDLALLYFPTLRFVDGTLVRLTLVPLQRRHFRLNRASNADVDWLCRLLDREGRPLGSGVRRDARGHLSLEWR